MMLNWEEEEGRGNDLSYKAAVSSDLFIMIIHVVCTEDNPFMGKQLVHGLYTTSPNAQV